MIASHRKEPEKKCDAYWINKQAKKKRETHTNEQEEPHDNADVFDELFSLFFFIFLLHRSYIRKVLSTKQMMLIVMRKRKVLTFFPLFFVLFLFSFVYIVLISEILTVHTRWMHNLAIHSLCSVKKKLPIEIFTCCIKRQTVKIKSCKTHTVRCFVYIYWKLVRKIAAWA